MNQELFSFDEMKYFVRLPQEESLSSSKAG
jgi:hypothetical protein